MANYNIYIDESGSINQLKKGIFEIAFIIVPEVKAKKTSRFFNSKIKTFKNQNGIHKNVELKAHFLKENNFLDFVDHIFHTFIAENKIVSAYIDNKNIISSHNNANARFFHMIEMIIERSISRKYIQPNDSIKIIADNRNNISGMIKKLKTNSLKKWGVGISEFNFCDSKTNTMIQVADIISFKCNRIIINSLVKGIKTPSIPNVSIRQVFY
ncbi:DUF3800 domain-containing protein [Mycoplasma marinum]|uniref:DUF3800 domain-containing protein n=1 Tax=Mycoplasma marinum TaxID=1937190 RepID=A0A4R0XL36_9MOLU|nr:DUF3800 domain-containing protein [Mycoplasma marinum]TCG11174.1 hypothetical protein C4B24_02730 [Mycoplasma marinum]